MNKDDNTFTFPFIKLLLVLAIILDGLIAVGLSFLVGMYVGERNCNAKHQVQQVESQSK